VYWSAAPLPAAAGVILDAVVSIQTRQWEAYPRVAVASSLAGAERVEVAAGVALLRVPGADWSYAEMALPEDFAGPAGAPGDAAAPNATRWTFGDQFMERGVIRRLRVRAAILPRTGDEISAARLLAALRAEQPPLTA
jgi:hypothetical protein